LVIKSQKEMFNDIMMQMVEEILRDSDIQLTTKQLKEEQAPFFAQMVESEYHKTETQVPSRESNLLDLVEFTDLVRLVLEETLVNLVNEVSEGEFDILAKSPEILSKRKASGKKVQINTQVTFHN